MARHSERAARRAAAKPREPMMRELSFMDATLEGLSEEMARDPTIFVLGEGVGKRGGNFRTTVGLYDRFGPERLRDTPISERGFVGLACGAAMTGSRPVVDFMFLDFILDSLGELINQVAKMQYMSSGRLKMPLLLRGCIGVGHSAATHHSTSGYPALHALPWLPRRRSRRPRRRQGAAQDRPADQRPGPVPRAQVAPEPEGAGAGRRAPGPLREGARRAAGQRHDGGCGRHHGAADAEGAGDPAERRHLRGS